jgi:predicted secreted acid phosphatase
MALTETASSSNIHGDDTMKRRARHLLAQVFLWTLILSPSFALAQNTPEAVLRSGLEEPENHTIVVDRLMRYHDSGEYEREMREVANVARDYLETHFKNVRKEEKLAAVFDIDETSLSNWDAMKDCGFCAYSIQSKYYSIEHDTAIVPVLELYNFAKEHGIAVFFVTGRPEKQRQLTVTNLKEVGYSGWTDLYMQPDPPAGATKPPAREFKPKNRQAIVDKGYRIVLSIGDQASDLAGCCAERVFKLPNPFYLIP